ncbi:hypothetical protein SBRY_50233 [Actinacidiphila bryophytorum]|uniref:Uncharacterized protein n=1 Tax=Actinacidiphila bryophytorum TaxID=1436133 RepID=A0A9W4MJ79_9ACTN|nr:hypothetical protein SBRY_50233 [Actinacidiphila bryophytorum]
MTHTRRTSPRRPLCATPRVCTRTCRMFVLRLSDGIRDMVGRRLVRSRTRPADRRFHDRHGAGGSQLQPRPPDHQRARRGRPLRLLDPDPDARRPRRVPPGDRLRAAGRLARRAAGARRRRHLGHGARALPRAEDRRLLLARHGRRHRLHPAGAVAGTGL